jgi:hypothetical protein
MNHCWSADARVAQQLDGVGGQLEVFAIDPLLSPARPALSQHDMVTATSTAFARTL